MHLALVCFFFEADALELAEKAGREATKLYTAKHGLEAGPARSGVRSSLRERLEDTLLLIPKLVDPIEIKREDPPVGRQSIHPPLLQETVDEIERGQVFV